MKFIFFYKKWFGTSEYQRKINQKLKFVFYTKIVLGIVFVIPAFFVSILYFAENYEFKKKDEDEEQ